MQEKKSLSGQVLDDFKKLPEGENINKCIQCGTCSASCPVADSMDMTPRSVMAKLRAGEIEDILKSDVAWVCASCYECTARCPSEIKITDFMYHLKREAEKHGYKPPNKKGLRMAKSFNKVVGKYGRSYEPELMVRANLAAPFNLLKLSPFGLKLFLHNRMPILPEKIKGAKHIKNALKNLEG